MSLLPREDTYCSLHLMLSGTTGCLGALAEHVGEVEFACGELDEEPPTYDEYMRLRLFLVEAVANVRAIRHAVMRAARAEQLLGYHVANPRDEDWGRFLDEHPELDG